jgi:aspartyl-tRNA(Asn)/glutamyl-tRNA(Gln) amidotransferase subunit A
MSTNDDAAERDLAAMEQALAGTAQRLHGIPGRTAPRQVAAEVLRLNDAVRESAQGRIHSGSQPGDFAALLLAAADPLNGDAA